MTWDHTLAGTPGTLVWRNPALFQDEEPKDPEVTPVLVWSDGSVTTGVSSLKSAVENADVADPWALYLAQEGTTELFAADVRYQRASEYDEDDYRTVTYEAVSKVPGGPSITFSILEDGRS